MDWKIDSQGWINVASRYAVRPRPGANGQVFTPLTKGLHPLMLQKYAGKPRGIVLHCTDCVVPDTAAFARRTATTSPRQSSYHFLIGIDGSVHQLASVLDRTWHAGRSGQPPDYIEVATKGTLHGKVATDRQRELVFQIWDGHWRYPGRVDGEAVVNPNNWAVGIEIMGKPGIPNEAQIGALALLLAVLYQYTAATPDTTWTHRHLDPLHRTDPGFDFRTVLNGHLDFGTLRSAWEERESGGGTGSGDPDSQ